MIRHTSLPFTGIALLALAVMTPALAGTPSRTVLRPHLKVGEQISHVFSRAISIQGSRFKEIAQRVSGTGDGTVISTGPEGVVMKSTYRYDGHSSSAGKEKFPSDGVSYCWDDKCPVNHETSGALFNRLLWGQPPSNLRVGATWTATIAEPWELGPPGTETVRVAWLDPSSHTVTLFREGNSSSRPVPNQHAKPITITTDDGASLEVTVIPGETRWSGRTIIRDGIIVADTIMVERHVTLVSASGGKFEAEERAYTLENLLEDRT